MKYTQLRIVVKGSTKIYSAVLIMPLFKTWMVMGEISKTFNQWWDIIPNQFEQQQPEMT